MKTNKEFTNIVFVLEYDRDKDRQTPNKIERTKELMRTAAAYAFCSISFSCGINTDKDTIAEYNTYIDVNETDTIALLNAVGAIWGSYVYMQDNRLKKYNPTLPDAYREN
tara:strand:- start:6612 stop:6941 length:330 start_codon:yes stop_codon:yes gene_type:complete